MNDILKEALKDVPVTKTDLPISSYGSVDLDELNKTVERLNKIPNMNDLVKENNKLQSNWNSLREWLIKQREEYIPTYIVDVIFNTIDEILNKMNELEGSDKE